MNRTFMCASIVVCSLTGTGRAEPVLLASFGSHVGTGSTLIVDPRVQMGITVLPTNNLPDRLTLDMYVFPEVFLADGESGVFDFQVGESEPLAGVAKLLTNGIDDFLSLVSIWPGSERIGIYGGVESFHLGGDDSPDQLPGLVGSELDFIRLTMRDVQIDSSVILGKISYSATFDYTYEFYGTPIPEPTTLGYGNFCALVVVARKAPAATSNNLLHGGNCDE